MAKLPTKTGFEISTGKVFRYLVVILLTLLAIHLLLQFLFLVLNIEIYSTLRGKFDVDNEISIPTWYAQLLVFIPACLGFILYKVEKAKNAPGSWYWLLLSALFVFLSMDEGAMLHEAFITKFREWTTDGTATGLANHLWLIPVGVVILLLLVPFWKFIRRLPNRTALLLSVGIGMFAFGVIVYETFGLMMFSGTGFAYMGLNVAIEEGLEMLGASIVVYALLEELRLQSPNSSVSLVK